MVEKYRHFGTWKELAHKYGADPQRVDVWDAFSELFLDASYSEGELDWIAENIAESPFSMRELGHIVFSEVGPTCFLSSLPLIAGAYTFEGDWLIPRCLEKQKRAPFREQKDLDNLPLYCHLLSPLYFEAYLMLDRVKRYRKASRGNT